MKAIVIYHSKYGCTKEYAEWIAAETGADLVPAKEAGKVDLSQYDTVAFGCPFYAGRLKLADMVKRALPGLAGKRVALFAPGATPVGDPSIAVNFERIFPGEAGRNIRFFPLGGRVRLSGLNFMERSVMKMMKATDIDNVKRESIAPVVEYVRGAV